MNKVIGVEASKSHQITFADFSGLRSEIGLASSGDANGNWKRLIAVVHPAAREVRFEVLTLVKPARQFEFLSDAILAYNGEPG